MSYRLELGLALLLATAIGVVVWAASGAPDAPSRDPRASTFLAGPQGSRALYDVLVRLGRPVERRRTSLFAFGAQAEIGRRRPALLVVLHPPLHLEPAELARVVTFVREGGAVLAAGDGGGLTRCAGWRLEPDRFLDDSVAVRPPPSLRPGLRLPRAARVLAPPREREPPPLERLRKRRAFAADDRCGTLVPRASDTLVGTRDGRPIVLRLHFDGGGTITLAADVGWFRNRVWRDTDVPQVVLPLLLPTTRGRVVWDEYHQGIGREGPGVASVTWQWLRRSPAGWAILQLIAVGFVWLAVTAVRFGPARSLIERRRRSPLEHLEALAAGLEGADGGDTAVRLMVGGLRRRLGRTGTVTADSRQPAVWLEGLELALSSVRGRQAVRELQRTLTQPGGGERALVAAQAVEDVWEELRPRRTPDGF